MKRASKIAFSILFVFVIAFSIVITSFASVASDASRIPVCPVLYGAYGSSTDTYVRSCGGYASNTKHMQNSLSTWYMYCVRTDGWTDYTKSANYFNISGYNSMFQNFDSIYYGAQTSNSSGVSYFNCMNTLQWYLNLTYTDSSGNLLEPTYSQQIKVEVTYLTSSNIYEVHYKKFWYDDYLTYVRSNGTNNWLHVNQFMAFIGLSYDEVWAKDNFITSVSIDPEDVSIGPEKLFSVFYRIPNANNYITKRTYQKSIIDMGFGGYNEGFDNGYDSGYDVGYNDGESFGYEIGYEDGYDYGFDLGYDGGYVDGESFGYEEGFNQGSVIGDNGVWGFISNSVGGFLSFEIVPGFYLGSLLLVCICVPLFVWILKMLAGG